MVLVLMGLVVFAAIIIVGYPLVNARFQEAAPPSGEGDERLERLAGARREVFEALRDLDLDRATGKLAEKDYQQLRGRYEVQAAQVLQELDAVSAPPVTAARPKNGRKPEAAASERHCPRCEARLQAGDRFCPTCGARLA